MNNCEMAHSQEWVDKIVFESSEHDIAVVKYKNGRGENMGSIFYGNKRAVPFGITGDSTSDRFIFDTAAETALTDGATTDAIDLIKTSFNRFYSSMTE